LKAFIAGKEKDRCGITQIQHGFFLPFNAAKAIAIRQDTRLKYQKTILKSEVIRIQFH